MNDPGISDQTIETVIAFDEIAVDAASLIQSMGYIDSACPEPVRLTVEEALLEAAPHVDIRGGYRILPDDVRLENSGEIECGACRFKVGKVIKGQLRRARRLALFAITIGDALETQARDLLRGDDPVKGYVLDATASLIVESAADRLHEQLRNAAAEWGWKTTNRFSPGYCGWPVEQQHILFAQLPAKFCGITLSETALMHPIKSVSGVIGLGDGVAYHPYPCDFCNRQDCYKRKR
ncbi:hypothetical protein JXA32_17750 [Candidatus Sumerlaeota bacterium]|nr:hypothetical protein [Candidatus Sumerlaeota bacterium]